MDGVTIGQLSRLVVFAVRNLAVANPPEFAMVLAIIHNPADRKSLHPARSESAVDFDM